MDLFIGSTVSITFAGGTFVIRGDQRCVRDIIPLMVTLVCISTHYPNESYFGAENWEKSICFDCTRLAGTKPNQLKGSLLKGSAIGVYPIRCRDCLHFRCPAAAVGHVITRGCREGDGHLTKGAWLTGVTAHPEDCAQCLLPDSPTSEQFREGQEYWH